MVKVLKYVWFVGVLSLLVGGGVYLLVKNIDNEFLFSEDRGIICIFVWGFDGVGLNFMDR